MKAALLKDIEKLVVEEIPDPRPDPLEALIRVAAVGICGTDVHLYHGHGNYNLDDQGRPIPLAEKPVILGHEFSGEVVEVGRAVNDLKPGDRVLCDQGINCRSVGRWPLCSYCASGDSHQCEHYSEHGITGPPGALADYIAMPALNCVKIPEGMTTELGALVEPLGCVVHSIDRAEQAYARYTFAGPERIRNVLISGAGPAGLLFLQYLRKVKEFDGLILQTDLRDTNLQLAEKFGATAINAARGDLKEAVEELTHGERVHLLIEATGNAAVIEQIPFVLRKQGTFLLYGHGFKGQDIGIWAHTFFLEPTLIVTVGASGGFDPDGRPTTFRRALELVSSGKVQVRPFVTHQYHALEDVHSAFEGDYRRPDYIKGMLALR